MLRIVVVLALPVAGLCALSGCLVFMDVDLTSSKSPFQETILEEARSCWTDEKVAVIDVHGLLLKRYDSSSLLSTTPGADPVGDLKEALGRAGGDEDVKAVVLRIDSPGGVVAWCDAMHREIVEFRKRSGKPVIASITSLGASGGYYIALAADKICAAPSAAVGSIGVLSIFLNLEGLASKIGVETQVVKSGARKDMGGLWRGLEPEERAIMQAMIDEYYERFVALILESRPGLTREKLKPVADGRLLTATQALEAGLVDSIAYLEDAVDEAKARAGLEDAAVVTYGRSYQYKNNLYSQAPAGPAMTVLNVDVGEAFGALPAGFYYLWSPGR
jgi:protease-4